VGGVRFKILVYLPLGWRPADVEKISREKMRDAITSKNISPLLSPNLMRWSGFSIFDARVLMYFYYCLENIAIIGIPANFFIYGGVSSLFDCLCIYTELMDKNSNRGSGKSLKSIAGLAIILSYGRLVCLNNWFRFVSFMLI